MKYGIQKFEFHLVGHNLLVRLDNLSFPKILDYRNKTLLDKQFLRLKNWFTMYDFTVQYIKGDKNLIPNLISRPPPKLIPSSSSILVTSLLCLEDMCLGFAGYLWKWDFFFGKHVQCLSSLHLISRYGFLHALLKGALSFMRSLKNSFCSQSFSRQPIAN